MQVLSSIISIILFILFLSVLIVVHELGHFAMAKAFKVYCFEFSIGMGPAIFKRKKKNGETQFTIRAIPFGGYVSMFDGEENQPDGVEIDPTRSMNETRKWKKAIIFSAGVIMNFVLAFTIYFIASWVPKNTFYVNYAQTVNNSTLPEGYFQYNTSLCGDSVIVIDQHATVTFKNGLANNNLIAACDISKFTFKELSLSKYLNFYTGSTIESTDLDASVSITYAIKSSDVIDISLVESAKFTFDLLDEDASKEKGEPVYGIKKEVKVDVIFDETKQTYSYSDIGVNFATAKISAKDLGDSLSISGKNFVNGSVAIFKSLGALFTTPEALQSAGGILAIGFESSNILKNAGWSYYLNLWALISVNLGIINLLPFPGLDGWHLLVIIVEGISRKKIPNKVKNIVSIIGISLLFALMIFLLFKDVFKYIFKIGLLVI